MLAAVAIPQGHCVFQRAAGSPQFLFSHLGLPGVLGADMPPEALRDRLKALLSLADWKRPREDLRRLRDQRAATLSLTEGRTMRLGEFSKPFGRLDACGRRISRRRWNSCPFRRPWNGRERARSRKPNSAWCSATTWCDCLRGFKIKTHSSLERWRPLWRDSGPGSGRLGRSRPYKAPRP